MASTTTVTLPTITATIAPTTIAATHIDNRFQALSVKLAAKAGATGDLLKGTLMGKVTASDDYAEYDDGLSNGVEVAVGVLAYPVSEADHITGGKLVGLYVKGQFLVDKLTGDDANGLADLGTVKGNVLTMV